MITRGRKIFSEDLGGKILLIFNGFFLGLFMFPSSLEAQSLTLELGKEGAFTGQLIQIILMMTVLSLAPSILVMVTSFTRMVVVFSFLRSALGLQQSPPNVVLISLSLFLTGFVMAPTLETAYKEGLLPYMDQKVALEDAFEKTSRPFHKFMRGHVRAQDLDLFLGFSGDPKLSNPQDIPLKALVPAFMISELRRSFEIGFLLFIPFIIIDLMVASVLMSMGMMMLPPMMLSLPFKVIFFVLVDGWNLIVGSLIKGFSGG